MTEIPQLKKKSAFRLHAAPLHYTALFQSPELCHLACVKASESSRMLLTKFNSTHPHPSPFRDGYGHSHYACSDGYRAETLLGAMERSSDPLNQLFFFSIYFLSHQI
ncbi:hypothetical protein CEXT_623931 [Caerostris extrusa]|uniref:Uncharacterized protein n=1 Tax=Caerostris extrusa TaxID=172846 RepID=A0AAV4MHF0_CAEEX|nr:hypothetical protein CEXT_623931 [Caerostris extrusa]